MDASQSLSLPSEGTLFLVNRFFDCIGGGAQVTMLPRGGKGEGEGEGEGRGREGRGSERRGGGEDQRREKK